MSTSNRQAIKITVVGKDRSDRELALRPRYSRGARKEGPYPNQSNELMKAAIAKGIGFFILARQLMPVITPNVELSGAARLYLAASSDQREQG